MKTPTKFWHVFWRVVAVVVLVGVVALSIAFLVTTHDFTSRFSHDETKSALDHLNERAAIADQHAEDNLERLRSSSRDQALARVTGCDQANIAQKQTTAGNVIGLVRLLSTLAGGAAIPSTERQRIVVAVVAYAQTQLAYHPLRDCTARGLDRYYHEKPGSTALALAGKSTHA